MPDRLQLPSTGWVVEAAPGRPIELRPPAPDAPRLVHIPLALTHCGTHVATVDWSLSADQVERLISGTEYAMAHPVPAGRCTYGGPDGGGPT